MEKNTTVALSSLSLVELGDMGKAAESPEIRVEIEKVISSTIKDRVRSTNKFDRDTEVVAFRNEITLARRAFRADLKELKASDVSNVISKHMENDFVVKDQKVVQLKNSDDLIIRLTRPKKAAPAPKHISEMSVAEIMDGLGDKGAALFAAMASKAQSKAMKESSIEA